MLIMAERRGFTCGADRDKAMRALGDLPFDQLAECFLVHSPLFERGYQRDERALEHRIFLVLRKNPYRIEGEHTRARLPLQEQAMLLRRCAPCYHLLAITKDSSCR